MGASRNETSFHFWGSVAPENNSNLVMAEYTSRRQVLCMVSSRQVTPSSKVTPSHT
jgi:hypothetical protein